MEYLSFFISLFYIIHDTYFILLFAKSYVVAIVIPDQEVLEPWAKSKKIPGDFGELCENEVGILHLIMDKVTLESLLFCLHLWQENIQLFLSPTFHNLKRLLSWRNSSQKKPKIWLRTPPVLFFSWGKEIVFQGVLCSLLCDRRRNSGKRQPEIWRSQASCCCCCRCLYMIFIAHQVSTPQRPTAL